MPDFIERSFFQRAGTLSLSLVLLVATLGACTTPGKTPTAAQVGRPTRLTFACPIDDKMIYQAIADALHDAHPDLEVQIVPMERSTPLQQLASRADTFVCYESCVEEGPAGLLLDLTPFLKGEQEPHGEDFLPGLMERFRWQGGVWGLPAGMDPLVVFYDPAVFDDAGVAYPTAGWTWDDLLSQVQRLTQREGEQVVRYGFVDLLGGGLESVIEERGAQIVDLSVEPPRPMLDDPRTVAAVQWYADLALTHGVMLNPAQAEGESPLASLLEGRAAMAVGLANSWAVAVQDRPSLGIVPLPGKGPLMSVYGYFISAGTTHAEAAWRWLQFLSRRVAPLNVLPARRSLISQSSLATTAGKEVLAIFLDSAEHALPPVRPVMARVWLSQALDQIFAGEAVEAALSTAQQKALAQATPAPETTLAPLPTPVPPAKDTIIFVTVWNRSTYEALAQAFHDTHPEIEVVVHGAEEFSGHTPAALIAASHADCILTPASLAEETRQSVLNLQPLVDTDPTFPLDDYDPESLERVSYQNDLWGLPAQVAVDVLYYDKALFDEAGIAYPTGEWTWDDWLAAARRLRGGEGAERCYGVVLWPGTSLIFLLEAMAGTLVDSLGTPSGFRFGTPDVVAAAQQLAGLVTAGIAPTLEAGADGYDELYDLNYSLIHSGQVGMWIQSSMSVGMEWARYQGRSIGVAPLPRGGRPVAPRSMVTAYYIAADTPHIEACWEWLKFVSDHIPQNGLSARRSLVASDEFRAYVGEEAQAAYLASLTYPDTNVFRDLEGLPGSRQAYTWLIQASQEILWQGADAQAALSQAQQKTEAYLDCLRQRAGSLDKEAMRTCFQAAEGR